MEPALDRAATRPKNADDDFDYLEHYILIIFDFNIKMFLKRVYIDKIYPLSATFCSSPLLAFVNVNQMKRATAPNYRYRPPLPNRRSEIDGTNDWT